MEVELRTWYPELTEGWALLEEDVVGIREACAARGVDFAAYAMVGSHVVFGRHWKSLMERVPDPEAYERGKEVRLARELFERNGIPTFDIVDALREGSLEETYYFYDGHLKPLGARLTAERIRDWIAARP
jgi:hypothetical protein